MRLVLALLVAGLAATPVSAAGEVVREQLPNGFTLLVRENPVAPVVALSLMVRAGTRWERRDNAGISNFLHAVMVKGTTRRSGGELAEAIAALGGKVSATGDVDYSEIRASALARFWRELLRLTAELALEPDLVGVEHREPAFGALDRDLVQAALAQLLHRNDLCVRQLRRNDATDRLLVGVCDTDGHRRERRESDGRSDGIHSGFLHFRWSANPTAAIRPAVAKSRAISAQYGGRRDRR